MSKGYSGLFRGTKGNTISVVRHSPVKIKDSMHEHVKDWAEKKRSMLSGKTKKNFNTACVAYDELTGNFYYGRNGGYHEKDYIKNPMLYGDSTHNGLLPKTSLNKYPIGNCAEVDAINQALNNGADIKNLHLTTIHVTKSRFGDYKESCENCRYAFKGKVKANYSGWKDED